MEFEDCQKAIAQIHDTYSNIVGTGFLIAPRYVLTCAHVVKSALLPGQSPIDSTVHVLFLKGSDMPLSARVIFYEFDETECGRDAAVLYLAEPLPSEVKPAALKPLKEYYDATVRSYGFLGGESSGRNLTAITDGLINKDWVQLRTPGQTGAAVEEGASGAPVWLTSSKTVVGLIVARDQQRESSRISFIIPTEKLHAPLQAIMQHELLAMLSPFAQRLIAQIQTAYKVCRPDAWPQPIQTSLKAILSDIAEMSPEGLPEHKLVQFAACLLNQSQIDQVKSPLIQWLANHTTDMAQLLSKMERRQTQRAPLLTPATQPYLLVSIQPDKATLAEPYQVNAWLIQNMGAYNNQTGEGAQPLTPAAPERYMGESKPSAQDEIRLHHLPGLLAAYLDDIGANGIDLRDLTIEFFLPLGLMNEGFEQLQIPDQFSPQPLGIGKLGSHVVIRSQDRLDYLRGIGIWRSKWQELQSRKSELSTAMFVSGCDDLKTLKQNLGSALGLKLARVPQPTEINYVLATGTPAAVWVRCQNQAIDWGACLDTQVLNCCIETLPQQVTALRRETLELENESDRELSQSLGHHLSFLWENPNHIPPDIAYSNAPL